jgi:hypothetical protein
MCSARHVVAALRLPQPLRSVAQDALRSWSGHFGPRILSLPSEGFYGLAHRCTSSSLTWCKFPEASCAPTVFAAKQRPRLPFYSCWQPLPPQKRAAGGVIVMRSATAELHACMATVPTLHRDPHRAFPVAPYYWRRPDHRAEVPPWTRPVTQACKAFWKARSRAPAARHCWVRTARSMVTDRVRPDACAGRRTPKRILRDSRHHLSHTPRHPRWLRASTRGPRRNLCVASQQSSCFLREPGTQPAGKACLRRIDAGISPNAAIPAAGLAWLRGPWIRSVRLVKIALNPALLLGNCGSPSAAADIRFAAARARIPPITGAQWRWFIPRTASHLRGRACRRSDR